VKVVVDAGPLLAAANRRDRSHARTAELIARLGRDAVVPVPVAVEVDHLLRTRLGGHAARLFLEALGAGEHEIAYLTPGLLRRAVAFDARFADLGLGLADASVMAVAERHGLPIFTFDFEHFRATGPERGFWRLVVDEAGYADWTAQT